MENDQPVVKGDAGIIFRTIEQYANDLESQWNEGQQMLVKEEVEHKLEDLKKIIEKIEIVNQYLNKFKQLCEAREGLNK